MGAVSAAESAIAGIGLATSLFGRQEQENALEEAIRLRLEQEEAANVERSTQRAHRLNEVMAAQVAREGASGLALSSPSFFAVGRDSFDQFAQDENADALNLSFDKLSALNAQKASKQSSMFGSMGDVFNAATTVFNAGVFTKSPAQQPVFTSQQQATPFPLKQHQSVMGELYSSTPMQDFIL
jgi:hypothetical protein